MPDALLRARKRFTSSLASLFAVLAVIAPIEIDIKSAGVPVSLSSASTAEGSQSVRSQSEHRMCGQFPAVLMQSTCAVPPRPNKHPFDGCGFWVLSPYMPGCSAALSKNLSWRLHGAAPPTIVKEKIKQTAAKTNEGHREGGSHPRIKQRPTLIPTSLSENPPRA
jgi:hypothetical protein